MYARGKEKAGMAKKQTRRTISVSRRAYDRARAFAAEKGVSLSQLTETALAHAIENFYKDRGDEGQR
jgi:post-segregation antitoxin (ccd killing protein)